MQTMVFQVSAKTARLIGRENISDVDGAIVELVKNSYDADAECVYLKFINPYNGVPKKLTLSEKKQYFSRETNLIDDNYTIINGKYVLKERDECSNFEELEYYIQSLSRIIVLDNGTGMNEDILRTSWMNIGTEDKEINVYSPIKKRIKTGAKGIGRFALDKLSLQSKVITKHKSDNTYMWRIDWTQFDNAKLLSQVNTDLTKMDSSFESIVKDYTKDDFELLREYDWSSGTLIELTPIRNYWSENLYRKVNNNLRNINPFESVDKFKIYVRNTYSSIFNYESEMEGIYRDDYDYCIEAFFDGKGQVNVSLDRNEIDVKKESVEIKYSETDIEHYDLEEFWNSDIFKRDGYQRNDFDGKYNFSCKIIDIIEKKRNKEVDIEEYNDVGPFSLKMYYLKSQKSTVEIVKEIRSRKRKKLTTDFSGIKIYRDNFKIRPYGESGQFYDWIDLSMRVQKSPAAASHESGNWRVSPNQIIGSVSIGRLANPKLSDNANREGMSLNREYDCFIEILQGIIGKFEYDRQYVLREYASWERNKRNSHMDKVQRIYEQVTYEKNQNKGDNAKENTRNEYEKQEYSNEEYKEAIYYLGKERDLKVSTEQLMMVLSASGVMAQTFAHEITRIATDLGSRGQHLKEAINRLLNFQPFEGDEDFNPYVLLDELNDTDELLSEWVDLIMDSIEKDKFKIREVELSKFLEHIRNKWIPLLNKKHIVFLEIDMDETIELAIAEIDLHLIVNNFILNSAYYLEGATGIRTIGIKVYVEDKKIIMEMKNNGPELHERYKQNPDESLNASETTKENGTGLGLWIAREATIRNGGNLNVVPISKGYMLRASWLK